MNSIYTLCSAFFFGIIHVAICFTVCIICFTESAWSQIPKPNEGDSLSYVGFFYSGISFRSLDVERLNSSLKDSKLNAVEDNAMFVEVGMKQSVGKGFLLGGIFNYLVGKSTRTIESNGNFNTYLSSFSVGLDLGYTVVQNSSVLILPSVGLTTGLNWTDITYASQSGAIPITLSNSIRNQLTVHPAKEIGNTTININIALAVETYFKLFSFAIKEEQLQGKPNAVIIAQSRSELWFGGFISYNPLLDSQSITSISSPEIGFTPSGFNYGFRLLSSTALRLLAP
jgi:hypothetical protein